MLGLTLHDPDANVQNFLSVTTDLREVVRHRMPIGAGRMALSRTHLNLVAEHHLLPDESFRVLIESVPPCVIQRLDSNLSTRAIDAHDDRVRTVRPRLVASHGHRRRTDLLELFVLLVNLFQHGAATFDAP